ncbi:ABC transporter ATP-binding protein [Anaerolinea sp.]|uniref:ABC transporter ATP-binding protein n=1 Tax=Anaerolinea sp. TaxID=1872519 RepID=UPI002ACE68DF|nr:ABC transporter ATP-binding protein [Anaerolinea sp.]
MSGPTSNPTTGQAILKVHGLSKYFPITKGLMKKVTGHVRAVDDVNLYVNAGETLSIVGESGSGKTTLGRCIVRALEPTCGQVELQIGDQWIDLTALKGEGLRAVRRHFHMIFQDPYSSLNPRMTVFDIIKEPLVYNGLAHGDEVRRIVLETLKRVGLEERHLYRYPHAFSGGQRQRIGIARSLVCNPKLIVCDEPVSALDVSIQAQILNLLKELQHDLNLSYLFIAHDLAVVEHISNRAAVMYVGKIVELAKSDEVFSSPRHPYTEALLSSVLLPDPNHKAQRMVLQGEIANPAHPPSGCSFHPRCRYATEKCKLEVPQWREISPEHFVACHHAAELQLKSMI